ncbi:MAG: hypothetical protein ACTSU5_13235 [Promethearchaeota archaeon]
MAPKHAKTESFILLDPRLNPYQDEEWARDWDAVDEIFEAIDWLKNAFDNLNTNVLQKMTEKQLVRNLEQYAWSLQHYLVDKYGKRDMPSSTANRA